MYPESTFDEFQKMLLDKLEFDDIVATFVDIQTGDTWHGTISDITIPHTNFPWYEIKWYEE